MFIRNGKRFNIYASQVINGVIYPNFIDPTLRQSLAITEIADPIVPSDYSDDTYYRTEQEDSPYVVYTKKPEEQLAQVRWNKLKTIRDNLISNGGVKVGTKWFHSDTHSKLQQLSLVSLGASLPAGIQWKTMDGSFIEMTPTLAQQIFAAQVAQENAIFSTAETKKLDTSDINTGWPEVYQDVV